jgi:hypothetical protein
MSARIWDRRRLARRRARIGALASELATAPTPEREREIDRRLGRVYARVFHPPRRVRVWLAS